jgi:hypothetical protein
LIISCTSDHVSTPPITLRFDVYSLNHALDNAGDGGQANSGDAFASTNGVTKAVDFSNGDDGDDLDDPFKSHVKIGKPKFKPTGSGANDGNVSATGTDAPSDDAGSRPQNPPPPASRPTPTPQSTPESPGSISGTSAPAGDDGIAHIPTSVKKIKPHRGDKVGDDGDVVQPTGLKAVDNASAPVSAAYSGAGGQAPGGSVTGTNGLINILSSTLCSPYASISTLTYLHR